MATSTTETGQPSQDVPEWVTLTEGETVRWSGHPSYRPVAIYIGLGLVVALAGAVLAALFQPWWAPLLLVPVGLAISGRYLVERWTVRYVVTSEEVYKKRGLYTRNVTQLRLDRVQNTSFNQSVFERFLDYGDIHVETAGSDTTELVFEDVPHPERVNKIITEGLDATSSSL